MTDGTLYGGALEHIFSDDESVRFDQVEATRLHNLMKLRLFVVSRPQTFANIVSWRMLDNEMISGGRRSDGPMVILDKDGQPIGVRRGQPKQWVEEDEEDPPKLQQHWQARKSQRNELPAFPDER